MWSRPCAIVTSIKWDVKFESSFTTMWSFHCKTKSYVQIGASLLKFSRTEDDLQFWVLYKFMCSSSSLICNIALCSVGEDLLSCTAVWFGVCVVHSFTIVQTQSERESENDSHYKAAKMAKHIDDSFEQPHSSLRHRLYPPALAQRTWHPWRALGPSLGERTKTYPWRRWGRVAKSSPTHQHLTRGTESLQGHPQGFPVLHVDRFAGLPMARHTEKERPKGVRSCPIQDRPGNRDSVASWWSRCCGIGSRKARRET